MSATVIPFGRQPLARPPQARRKAVASLAAHFGEQWAARHLPLILAALDMLQADDPDFGDRCRLIASEPGALARLVDQLARLAVHMADVAEALRMLVQRIRAVPLASTSLACPEIP